MTLLKIEYFSTSRNAGVCGGGGGGRGTPIFSYIHMAWTIYFGLRFWVRNFQIQYFWGFQKNEYIWGMKKLLIFWLGHYIIGLIWGGGGGHSIYFYGFFLRQGIFLGSQNFKHFFGNA